MLEEINIKDRGSCRSDADLELGRETAISQVSQSRENFKVLSFKWILYNSFYMDTPISGDPL